jgi:acetyltransferase-like isoleucine patch superfamily enzyme
MENSFYSAKELKELGFKSFGENVLLSKKASFYGESEISFGNNIRIDDFCILSGKVSLGNYVHIGAGSYLFGGENGITMDDFSGCSQHVCIYATSDDYSGKSLTNPTVPDRFRNLHEGAVTIEKYVIIGAGSVLLPSVIVREGSAIGALSLVDKSTEQWKIYFGSPAIPINNRNKKILELEKEFLEDAKMHLHT